MSLQQCVDHDDDAFFFAHMQFFAEIDRRGAPATPSQVLRPDSD
jgi:hypothetical protein